PRVVRTAPYTIGAGDKRSGSISDGYGHAATLGGAWTLTRENAHLRARLPPCLQLAGEPQISEHRAAGEDAAPEASEPERAELGVLRALAHHLSDAIVLSRTTPDDPVLRIAYVNDAFCRLTGFEAADVLGASPAVLAGPETDLDALRRIESALRSHH